ncbi:MAG: response regulator transcription factor [Limnobacter sp.]|nr:response regulator transcription factor [Limnobacter sp.]
MKILAISGDDARLGGLAIPLREAGNFVEAVADTSDADAALRAGHFDAIVLDLEPPATEALNWLRGLRERRVRLAVLTLTRSDDVDSRIAAVQCGADDHQVHPIDPRELVARCQALMRRGAGSLRSEAISCGELVIDSRKREVRHGSVPISLTPREWSILEFLVTHVGTAVAKDRLLRAIAGWDEQLAPNAIEVYVSRLRGKLAGTGTRISTVRAVGYRLEPPEEIAHVERIGPVS